VKTIGKGFDNGLNERLAARGLRFTCQREQVYRVLLRERDHPTAEQVFVRAKADMPDISLATVYNCLEALVKCRLVRQVVVNRGATRYCPNMSEHCHFYCEDCSGVFDLDLAAVIGKRDFEMPRGFQATGCEISFRGQCRACAARRRRPNGRPVD
jgi:Fur family peroxide stress response transcriptional regulator